MRLLAYILELFRWIPASCIRWLPSFDWRRVLRPWASFQIHPAEPTKRPSAAQRCNDDVLAEVFLHLDAATLASAAQVCRAWLPAASRALYHDIFLAISKPSASKLALSLTSYPHLRSLVRHVTIQRTHFPPWDPSYTDWLALLPAHRLRSIIFRNSILAMTEALAMLEYPAVQTAPCIITRSETTYQGVNILLNMVQLETLALLIDRRMPFPEQGVSLPNLRRLGISLGRYSPVIEQILQSLNLPLQRFELHVNSLKEDDLASLRRGLEHHAPSLTHLSFIGRPLSKIPFMDDYILSFPSLKTLQCSFSAYTSLLISRLPPTLESLILRAPPPYPFSDEYAAALEQHRSKLPALSKVTVLVCDPRDGRLRCDSLAEVCHREGITLRMEVWNTETHSIWSP